MFKDINTPMTISVTLPFPTMLWDEVYELTVRAISEIIQSNDNLLTYSRAGVDYSCWEYIMKNNPMFKMVDGEPLQDYGADERYSKLSAIVIEMVNWILSENEVLLNEIYANNRIDEVIDYTYSDTHMTFIIRVL